jgi:hypothetical protein
MDATILLNINVIIYLISELILYFLLFIAFLISFYTVFNWDYNSFSKKQYLLEKRAFLVMSIILFSFVIKFMLLPYFVYVIDKLSNLVPGAMCAAGVVSANSYGFILLFFKLLIIFGMILWLVLNHYDLESKKYDYFKAKNWIFIAIFILLSIEILLDILYFSSIDPNRPVSCCSTLFGHLEGENPLPFGLDIKRLLILFFALFFISQLALLTDQNFLILIGIGAFLYISYYSVVYFFGTYIYELPTHKCPFCMLQKEYYYIGYLIWGTLFGGSFIALVSAILSLTIGVKTKKAKLLSSFLLGFFVTLCIGYVAFYYLKNGVFL